MTFGASIVTAPTERVVSLDEVRAFLRVDSSESDVELLRLIEVATDRIVNLTRRQLCTATRRLILQGFPCARRLELPWPPLQSIVAVTYFDENGASQTWASSKYFVSTATEPGYVAPKQAEDWPATYEGRPDAVTVEYVAGYATVDAIPEALRHAVLMSVGHYYEQRGELTRNNLVEAPQAVGHLIEQYLVGDEFLRYGDQ